MAYSIIQWGSGNVGAQVIAQIARRRDLTLKGLFVYNPDKVGMDAGHIAGIKKSGVKATNSVERILALDADCVIHAPRRAGYRHSSTCRGSSAAGRQAK